MSTRDTADGTAAALRRAFDGAFVKARGDLRPAFDDFLAIRAGGDPYALRLSEVAGLHRDRSISPVTSRTPHLLGMTALRGALASVFDLRTLLGYAGGPAPRWLVLGGEGGTLALAFEDFESHLRVSPRDVSLPSGPEGARRYLRGVVRVDAGMRPIVDVASIVEAITGRSRRDESSSSKER